MHESTDASAVLGVVEALLATGTDVTVCDSKGDMALFHYLAVCSRNGQPVLAPAAARLLLASGADGCIKITMI